MRERFGKTPVLVALALGAAMALSAALLLFWGSKLTFLLDDWEFLLYRPGFSAHSILEPHGEHISIAPVLIYKALFGTAGMSSSVPYLAVSVALFLSTALLVFVYLRRRLDPWLALAGAVVVLFLGPAFDDLIWDFQMGFNGSLACGLGAILLLEREDRRGDVLACALLTLGLTFSSLGLPFVVAAAVDLCLRPERLRRLYVVGVPALLYVVWWAGWGHHADTAISFDNAEATPQYVLDAAAASLAALLGLVEFGQGPGPGGLDWGRPLLLVAIALGAWRLHRMGRVPRTLWVALALAGAFWVLAGLNVRSGRGPTESRYLLPGAVFLLMIAAELLRGIRLPRLAVAGGCAAGALIALSNVFVLRDAYHAYRNTSDLIRADLGALEIARGGSRLPIRLTEPVAGTAYVGVDSTTYLAAADEHGSPADTPAELAAAPEPARIAADRVLGLALGVSFGPATAAPPPTGPAPELAGPAAARTRVGGSCIVVDRPGAILRLPPGGASVQAGGAPASASLRRFADSFSPAGVRLGPGGTAVARIPPDAAAVPWELAVRSTTPATVCGIGP
jgi:hypothetical protein